MMLAPRRFADDLRITPPQSPKLHGQRNPRQPRRRRRSAAFPDGDIVINLQRQRCDFPPRGLEHFAVRRENEMILQIAADFFVAPGGGDGKSLASLRLDLDVEVHRQSGRIESRTQVGRGRRQRQAHALRILLALAIRFRWHQDFSACSSVRSTASSVASRTIGGRRNAFNSPLASSSFVPLKSSPRWNSIVKSGSFSRLPVNTSTTLSLGFTNPCFSSF